MAFAPNAFANGDQVDRQTFTTQIAEPIENPCNGGRIAFQGTQTTKIRSTQKENGSSEFRFEEETRGEGPEDISQVLYRVDERRQFNSRSNQQVSRFVQRFRQKGNPERPLVPTPTSTLAVGWLLEEKEESHTNPAGTRSERDPATLRCRDENGDGKEDF